MKYLNISTFLISVFFFQNIKAQNCIDYSVLLEAQVQESPAQITIHWNNDVNATQYIVYRKALNAISWGIALTTLTGTDSQYVDTNVQTDTAYEYKVQRNTSNASVTAYGYIYAGIKNPAIHFNGRMLVLVDSFFTDSVETEIFRMEKDLCSAGWDVTRKDFSRTNNTVTDVKNYILNEYNNSTQNVKVVLLIGHIPVPYSGDLNPDGHPDHLGAWPADVYYGEMNSVWDDVSVNDTLAGRPENRNKPGDGKFDPTYLPSNVELEVSRIDFYNMPSNPNSEITAMKNYLNRDHAYRKKEITLANRGLIDDNFGGFGGEAFAANGWKNFSPLIGAANIHELDFISTLDTADYLWAYGCGGGWFQGSGGVGNSTDMMNNHVNSIFTMLFGSYFGDWDSQDNFLRSPLCAQTPALTCAWPGRPNWQFHHMGLGMNIGYSEIVTQNNSSQYIGNYGNHYVHVALMGDLSLKQNVLAPPQSISTANTNSSFGKIINWTASFDTVLGYYVYRSSQELEGYQLISDLVNGNSFTDSVGTNGLKYFMVRASRLENTPSGTYFNLSEGVVDSATVQYQNVSVNKELNKLMSVTVFPNPVKDEFQVAGLTNGINYQYSITGVEGKILLTGKINSSTKNISVKNFTAGVYLLKISNEENNIVLKLNVAE
ncbi:MAG: T9SS type A sorting domain-containing protein [Bacteroidota bacterium]